MHHTRYSIVPHGVMPGWEGDSTTKEEGGGWTKVRAGLSFSYAGTTTHTIKSPAQYTCVLHCRSDVEVEHNVAVQSVVLGRLHCQEGLSKSSNEHLQSPKQMGVQ